MFDYNSTVLSAANQFGVPSSIAFGLFQQESGNNPNMGYTAACPPGKICSAYGPGQLTIGAANQVGVNRFDPTQNIYGSMNYLSQFYNKYGNWTDALASYNQGHVNSAGLSYAASVLNKAKGFMSGVFTKQNIGQGVAMGLDAAIPGLGTGIAGLTGLGGGESWLQQFQDWLKGSGFFERLALAFVGFILMLGVVYTLKGK